MKTTLNVLFKKMQKDDKKEVLVFQINGDELDSAQTLVELAGGIVVMSIEGCDAGDILAEFASLQLDSKKTALKFNIKGDSEEKAIKLYPFAGRNVKLSLQESQMSIGDYYGNELPEGGEGSGGGEAETPDENQVTMEEAAAAAESENVTQLETARSRRGRRTGDQSEPSVAENTAEASGEDKPTDPEDELPF